MTWEYIDLAPLSLHAYTDSENQLFADLDEGSYSCVDGFTVYSSYTTYYATAITFTIDANIVQSEYFDPTDPIFCWKNGIMEESLVSIYLTAEDGSAYLDVRDHSNQSVLNGPAYIDINEPITLRIMTRTPWQNGCTCEYDILQNTSVLATAQRRTENYYFSDGNYSDEWGWYPYAILSEISDCFRYSEGALQCEIRTIYLNSVINGEGSGNIIKNPDKESYESEEIVTCTAEPSANSYFSHWVYDSTENTENPVNITIGSQDSTIEAWFNLHPYLYIENKQGAGIVKFNTTQVTTGRYYPAGTAITISLVPNEGYEVGSLSINGSKVTLNSQFAYTLEMPASDVAISVTFKKSAVATPYGISSEKIIMSKLNEASGNIDAPYLTQNYTLCTTHFIENQYLNVDGAKYIKVFDHDVSADPTGKSSYFSNEGEAKHCFKPNKFSRLGDLGSNLFKSNTDHKYEFLLRYPGAWHTYSADTNSSTGIMLDWTKSFHINLDVELLSESMNQRQLIIGNYRYHDDPGNYNNFSVEITTTNQLRLYINDKDLWYSVANAMSAGLWNIDIDYNISSKKVVVTAKSSEGSVVTLDTASTLELSPNNQSPIPSEDPLVVGASDYRIDDGFENPFHSIRARIDSTGPTNIWKQTLSPFEFTSPRSGQNPGSSTISINMPITSESVPYHALGYEPYGGSSLLKFVPGEQDLEGELGCYAAGKFTAPDSSLQTHAQLWVRVDNTPYDAYTAIQKTVNNEYVIYSDNFIEKSKETK